VDLLAIHAVKLAESIGLPTFAVSDIA
jgi:hypothetical protein